jgi:hypothetical protein
LRRGLAAASDTIEGFRARQSIPPCEQAMVTYPLPARRRSPRHLRQDWRHALVFRSSIAAGALPRSAVP